MEDIKSTIAISLKIDTLKDFLEEVQGGYDPEATDWNRGYKAGIKEVLETILSESKIEL